MRRYNTIIIPSGSSLSKSSREILSNWIKQGGTLIAHNRSVRQFTDDEGIGNVKQLQYTFDESQDFNIDLQRELFSLSEDISIDKTLSNKVNTEIIASNMAIPVKTPKYIVGIKLDNINIEKPKTIVIDVFNIATPTVS